jgi:hypothetical protein
MKMQKNMITIIFIIYQYQEMLHGIAYVQDYKI